jgi:hypothetical protein
LTDYEKSPGDVWSIWVSTELGTEIIKLPRRHLGCAAAVLFPAMRAVATVFQLDFRLKAEIRTQSPAFPPSKFISLHLQTLPQNLLHEPVSAVGFLSKAGPVKKVKNR